MKFNERTKHFFIKIYLSFYSQKSPQFVVCWEIDGETYTRRGDFFRGPGGANACTPLQAETPLIGCVSLARLPILSSLSKSNRVVLIMWPPSGYTPVGPNCPDALSSPYLLITTWQLVKAYRVTRNEPKIHIIRYITFETTKVLVLDRNTWNHTTVSKLFVFHRNTWYHTTVIWGGTFL